jgi:hypothetical protein
VAVHRELAAFHGVTFSSCERCKQGLNMTVNAIYQGVQYQIEELSKGEWQWSFQPPKGPRQSGRARGESRWAVTVVQRAIDIWHLMNRASQAA